MDTAEARTTTGGEAGGPVYDAFLSYSHAADELLAPRLQAGLQRFAKPWWRRRALHVFRDEASLSANPHLWGSITEALDDSAWFVLLLSPDAADSVWVDREVEYWLAGKDPERIIPVVTDGEFAWVDGALVSDAAPPALQGAFTDEPRWVDLRFARTEEQLDLKNPRFSAAVADIASAIRGVPKDELESEEVRQHRSTVRTAWAAAIVVVLFALLSAAAAIFALDQRNDAQVAAEAEAEQRVEAEEARAAEAEQRLAAQEQAQLAESRGLAASAINVLDDDPELSVLLALQAAEGADPAFESVSALHEALRTLHEALRDHRTIRLITWPGAWPTNGPAIVGSISPDGRHVAVSGARHQLAVWEVGAESDEPLWTFEVPWPDYAVIVPYFTTQGHVVATVSWFSFSEPADSWPEPPPEVGVYLFDVETGEVIRHIRSPECPIFSMFQTGRFFDEARPVGLTVRPTADCSYAEEGEVWLMDLSTGEMTLRYAEGVEHLIEAYPRASLSDDGRYLSFLDGETARVLDLETGADVFETKPTNGLARLSGDASRLLTYWVGISLWDTASGTELWNSDLQTTLTDVWFSEDESLVYAGGEDGSVRVLDATTGELRHELEGHRGWTWPNSMSADGTTLASFSADHTVRISDFKASAEGEIAGYDLPGVPVVQSGKVAGDRAAILLYPDYVTAFDEPGVALVFDPSTGETLYRFEGYGAQMVRLSPDGTLLAGQPFLDTWTARAGAYSRRGERGSAGRVGVPVQLGQRRRSAGTRLR